MLIEAQMASRRCEMKVDISTQSGHLYTISWLDNVLTNWNRSAGLQESLLKVDVHP